MADTRYRIALDAMGGDYGPAELVKGAVLAARKGAVEVLLVGDPQAVSQEMARHEAAGLPITLVPSQGVIREGTHPVAELRQNPRVSVAVAAGLVEAGKADAFVSMGSTGASMACAVMALGLLEGVERPALGGPFLGLAPKTSIIDLGSQVDCRPSQLLSFAVLGCAFASKFLEIPNPRVALLSVGSEEGKGNRQVQEAYKLFQQSGLNFVGNVEGYDLFLNKADVIICDGFVGNILLKYSEGLLAAVGHYFHKNMVGKWPTQVMAQLGEGLKTAGALAEQAGGPLFGINGVAIVGHGKSRANAIAGSIRMARRCLEVGLVPAMAAELAKVRSTLGGLQPGKEG